MQTALEKIASFAVHTDYEKIPDDVLEAAQTRPYRLFLPVLLPGSTHRSAKTSLII